MIYSVVFPVRYSDQFFKDVVANSENGLIKLGLILALNSFILHILCSAAYHNAVMVGGICCRYEVDAAKIYIMTIAVLAPYQRCGIGELLPACMLVFVMCGELVHAGSKLLEEVLKNISKNKTYSNVREIYLHVQVCREDSPNI